MFYHSHMTWTLHPSHHSRARLLICTLLISAISSCAHIALFCQCHSHRLFSMLALPLVIASKPAPVLGTHSIVCHSLSPPRAFSLPRFCLDRYTFIAASWTMYLSLHVHLCLSFSTCVASSPAFHLLACPVTNASIRSSIFAAVY